MSLLPDGQRWAVHFGDCIEHMAEMPPHSVDFSIFSPPFPSLFSYTDKAADIGNWTGDLVQVGDEWQVQMDYAGNGPMRSITDEQWLAEAKRRLTAVLQRVIEF